jgi:hypothetical protein
VATRGQIALLAARIEGLAQRSDAPPKVAFVWRDCGETDKQALERHYGVQREDGKARITYFIGRANTID